jgi:hypothetical protein
MPKPGEDGNFQSFHLFRPRWVFVIESQKMQDTMHHHMSEMGLKGFSLGMGSAFHRLEGDHRVSQGLRSG